MDDGYNHNHNSDDEITRYVCWTIAQPERKELNHQEHQERGGRNGPR
jgi:hypothetical protein